MKNLFNLKLSAICTTNKIMIPALFLAIIAAPISVVYGQIIPLNADPSCMQNAIGKRDNAMSVELGEYSAKVAAGLQARKFAYQAAWLIPDATMRKSTIGVATASYREVVKNTRNNFKKAKSNIWKTFKKERKDCAGNKEDRTSSSLDSRI